MRREILQDKYKYYFDWTNPNGGIFIAIEEILVSRRTQYQFVEVIRFGEFGLSLVIDGKIQVAEADEFVYHETLVHIPAIAVGNPENVLVIGGGDGCTIREVFKHKSVKRCVMVDIDPEVIEICKEYLAPLNKGSFYDPRLELIFDDGRRYLERTDEKFDLIILDSVDPIENSPSYLLFTKEFMEVAKEHLTPRGIIAVQSNFIAPSGAEFIYAMYKTLEQVFPKVSFASAFVNSFSLQWAFTFGCLGRTPDEVSVEEAEKVLSQLPDLKYLDGEMYKASLARPKFFKERLKNYKRIITDKEPMFVL